MAQTEGRGMTKNPVDIHVGSRLRLRRTLAGLSQEKLGEAVGLTFQQIQKYEKGANRIGASRLFQFARVLDVPPAFFFEGLDAEGGGRRDPAPAAANGGDGDSGTRESLEMMRAFSNIRDLAMRRRILDLVKSVAGRDGD
jgi:transcriptional regulator with XRE-family HTH domain